MRRNTCGHVFAPPQTGVIPVWRQGLGLNTRQTDRAVQTHTTRSCRHKAALSTVRQGRINRSLSTIPFCQTHVQAFALLHPSAKSRLTFEPRPHMSVTSCSATAFHAYPRYPGPSGQAYAQTLSPAGSLQRTPRLHDCHPLLQAAHRVLTHAEHFHAVPLARAVAAARLHLERAELQVGNKAAHSESASTRLGQQKRVHT